MVAPLGVRVLLPGLLEGPEPLPQPPSQEEALSAGGLLPPLGWGTALGGKLLSAVSTHGLDRPTLTFRGVRAARGLLITELKRRGGACL